MTLLQLVQSKSPREHGTMIELIEAINTVEKVVGETIYVHLRAPTTNVIAADMSSAEATGDIAVNGIIFDGNELNIDSDVEIYSTLSDIDIR